MATKKAKKSIGFAEPDDANVMSKEHTAAAAAAAPDARAVIKFGMVKIGRTYETLVAEPPTGPVKVGTVINSQLTVFASNTEGKWQVKAQLHATDEGIFETPVSMTAGGQEVKVVISGHVMGHGKGTPSMREGVHCVGRDDVVVTDSDESDRGLPDLDADAVERAGTIRARKWRKSASNAAAE